MWNKHILKTIWEHKINIYEALSNLTADLKNIIEMWKTL